MAKKKVGDLIKEARTNAGLTQEQLAKQVEGVSASDISKAERGEKELTQAALKQIAKATGVTQKSLIEAASGSTTARKTSTATGAGRKTSTAKTSDVSASAKTSAAKKTSTAKTSDASAQASGTSAAKKTSTAKTSGTSASAKTSAAKKTSGSSGTSVKLTAAEKKFIELYRKANAEQRKAAEAALKGEESEGDDNLLESLLGGAASLLSNLGK